VDLALQLTAALDFLISIVDSPDIKPSNIIFVNGRSKFADVGLVTDIDTKQEQVTLSRHEGYIAPEGPGTPAADVFSLGKFCTKRAWAKIGFSSRPTDSGLLKGARIARTLQNNLIQLQSTLGLSRPLSVVGELKRSLPCSLRTDFAETENVRRWCSGPSGACTSVPR